MDNLSVLACKIWEICWEIELNMCKHKDEEECQKEEIFSLNNEYFIEYKENYSSKPILVS